MHPSAILSTALLLALASALPLNINLGAYSPALVVGDGAIEFEGGEAAEGIAARTSPTAQQKQTQTHPQPPNTRLNTRRLLQPRIPYHPLLHRRLDFPTEDETTTTTSSDSDSDDPVLPSITLPVPVPPDPDPDPDAKVKRAQLKRQANDGLSGFDRALQFAEVALTSGPDIQLGTGGHGAGVGMIIDNGGDGQGASESVVVPFPTAGGGGQPSPAPAPAPPAAGGGGGAGGLAPPLAPGGGQIASGGQGVVVVGRPG
ncbi:hypothetical protein QBC39DRAFT_407366 [Podospora conica]|nr:hypothetical protein QBC39DRAFT_407366 [Schizothecium conicum]